MLKVDYEGLSATDIYSLTIQYSPELNITLNTTHVMFNIINTDFTLCPDIKYEVQIMDLVSGDYTSLRNMSDTVMGIDKYRGQELRVR